MSTRSADLLVLSIETSTPEGSVAVTRDEELLAERLLCAESQGPGLLGEVEEVLAEAGVALRDLAGIACGLGPGRFTGLRVGLATAKGLAYALGLPLRGVPSLEALAARAAPRAGGGLVVPAIDARRGEVYAAAFDSHLARVLPECARTPEALGEALRALGRPLAALGSGAVLFAERIGVPVIVDPDLAAPRAREVALLAVRGWEGAVRGASASALAPMYIRPSDAELNPKLRSQS